MGGMVADAVEAKQKGHLAQPQSQQQQTTQLAGNGNGKRRAADDRMDFEPSKRAAVSVLIAGASGPKPGVTTVKVTNLHVEASEPDLKVDQTTCLADMGVFV